MHSGIRNIKTMKSCRALIPSLTMQLLESMSLEIIDKLFNTSDLRTMPS